MKFSRAILPLLFFVVILCSLFLPSEGRRGWYGRSLGYRGYGGYGYGRGYGYGGRGRFGYGGRGRYGYGRYRRYGYGRRRYG
ncbi:keratin-associated protein 19-2-like [Saccostrea echinata]|uniref:keratin-associated protein 19-2-like n=1 Tax=Saccostrea echinata TaxID=191078 RepID=UPI002A83EE27|nr:keratin-associated protein 19-2-like [Saccostrea echinata]